ncbi:MAG: DUF3365 domain-containing protein [Thermodesulfovibrionales bacterium]|nr:DUF3365 domain-containing protein [Thermodesulfovibrionales bacterium]
MPQKFRDFRLNLSAKFIIACSLTLIVALGLSFYFIAKRQERLIMMQVENEARAIFKQIVITREWIADHGGVFVQRLPWMKPNPYLSKMGKESEVIDVKGRRFVLETPAMVTKALSKYAKDRELYWFHITSLKLTNPENAPDEFEKKALLQFEKNNVKELISIETIDKSKYLRYISPLYVEDACLKCHAYQGYQAGDVRGAISITIPLDKTFAKISTNTHTMLIAGILTVFALIVAMFFTVNKLVLTPMRRLKTSIKEFSDGNYSPSNRLKTGDEFEKICCAFSEMAHKLTNYHDYLNDKIHEATENLETTNTKLLEANRLLRDANLKKSDFIARASHELRTPLTSIKGAMDYISTKLSSSLNQNPDDASLSDLYVFFGLIKKNSERLIRMVNDMLDIERMEMGVSELHFASVNLSYIIAEIMTSCKVNADEKSISIKTHIPDCLYICADEDRIRQVIVNLLSNAIKFSPEKTEVLIFAYCERSHVVVEIWDEGHGINAHQQERIFEKFYRIGNKEGAGLGLAICKSIIDAHKGIVGVKSDGQNGNCFYFKLPNIKCTDMTPETYLEQARQQHKLLEIAERIGTC